MKRRFFAFGACLALGIATPIAAQAHPDGPRVSVKAVAEKLGARCAPQEADDLDLGRSVTGMLADPAKLSKLGIRAMHEGARVTITRVAPDKIRVEADEMEPLPTKGAVTLRVGSDGTLAPAPAAQPTAPKPPIH